MLCQLTMTTQMVAYLAIIADVDEAVHLEGIKGITAMDMKEQTRNSLLTAMVCVALSSGTAWAAVPEVQVPTVQQSAAGSSAASLAEASVADVVAQEKARKKAAENMSLTGSGKKQENKQETRQMSVPREDPSVMSAKLHSMPLYWSALKPKEEQVKKAQPIIITADDIEAKRKEEKRAAAVQAAKAPQKAAEAERVQPKAPAPQPPATAQTKPAKPANVAPAQVKPAKPASSAPAQAQPVRPEPAVSGQNLQPKAQQPAIAPAQPAPAPVSRPQPAAPAVKPQPVVPVAKPAAQNEYRPQPQPAVAPAPQQENVPAPAPRQMVKLHPEGLYASRRQRTLPETPASPQPAYKEESQVRPLQPAQSVQQPLPKQVQVERPPEFEGISDEVVRHIMAGEYAMRYQLARDASEPGVYHLTQILNQNTGLSHLQKIEYLIGFGRAINRSNLSEYQKKALIDAVIDAFGKK